MVAQIIENMLALYEYLSFINTFTTGFHWNLFWARLILSTYSHTLSRKSNITNFVCNYIILIKVQYQIVAQHLFIIS